MDFGPTIRLTRRCVQRATVSSGALAFAAASILIGGCASDNAASGNALNVEQATERLAATCVAANQRLSQLPQPTDVPGQAVWAGDIADVLDDHAAEVRALVLLDEEQRVDVRAFADNTTEQASAWRALSELLESDAVLSANTEVSDLTTEITELSLGRDDLSDELGVAACRRV